MVNELAILRKNIILGTDIKKFRNITNKEIILMEGIRCNIIDTINLAIIKERDIIEVLNELIKLYIPKQKEHNIYRIVLSIMGETHNRIGGVE